MTGSDFVSNGEIFLSGPILSAEYVDFFEVGFSATHVRQALGAVSGDVTVHLNSEGGNVFEAEQIRAMLAGHEGRVTVIVEGLAASAATLAMLGAAEVRATLGSAFMIHDPSAAVFGNEAELRKEADALATLASAYAEVYARKLGISAAEARAIMQAETWYSASEARALGLVDAIEDEDAAEAALATRAAASAIVAVGRAHYAEMRTRLDTLLKDHRAGASSPAPSPAAPRGEPAAVAASNLETVTMSDKPKAATPAATTPNPAAAAPTMAAAPQASAVDEAAIRAQARTEERQRVADIRMTAKPFLAAGQIDDAFVTDLIMSDVTASAAKGRILDKLAEGQAAAPSPSPRAVITRDETDTQMAGMIDALMGRFEGPAAEYRGLTVKKLAMALSGSSSFNDAERVRQGMLSTSMMGGAQGVSDFSYITTEVMNRSLMAEYTRRPSTWRRVTGAPITASDFRELAPVRFGGDLTFKPVQENGEYEEAVLSDEAEGLKVIRYGRKVSLTFEAIVNDDMGAFTRIPTELARAAARLENSTVWGLIRTNAVLKSDNVALFHTATHKNLASSGAAISSSTIGAARKAMWEQKAFKAAATSDDFLEITPNIMVVPPALEETALKFVSNIVATKDSDANPYKGTLEPVIVPALGAAVTGGSDSAWYLFDEDFPPISHAYLEGYAQPTFVTTEGMNPDKVEMTSRHIFGAAVTEYRGSYKNAGA